MAHEGLTTGNAVVNLKQNRAGSVQIYACGDCGADAQIVERETVVAEAGTKPGRSLALTT